jgi:hypothetical protein
MDDRTLSDTVDRAPVDRDSTRAPSKHIVLGHALARTDRFRSRIGRMLLERGLITKDELRRALDAQPAASGQRVGEVLVAMGAVSSDDLTRVLAEHLQLPFVDLRANAADASLASLLPEDVARTYQALPVARWGTRIVVAMAAPNDPVAVEVLQTLLGSVTVAIADPIQLRAALTHAYDAPGEHGVRFTCPGCADVTDLAGPPWIMHDEHRAPDRYYVWDRDPASHRPAHVCAPTRH